MKKVKLQVCNGTTCFVMGGADMQNMLDQLMVKFKDCLEIERVRCLNACSLSDNFAKAPYANIDGQLVGNANFQTITKIIEEKLSND